MYILVAIGAELVLDRSLEVRGLVAGDAAYFRVLAQQRKGRFGVIELRLEARLLPGGGGVARGAILLEFAFVRVGVAGGAGGEGNARIPRPPVGSGSMALQASHFQMPPGERVICFGVVEALPLNLGIFPVGRIVACCAGGAQAALVMVLVARDALGRQPHVG